MAKKSEQQKIVDRLVRTLQPFGKKKRERILKIVELTLDEADEEEEEEDFPEDMKMSPAERKAIEKLQENEDG